MTSGRITSRQIDEETMETVRDFIFLVSKITADGDCNHEIKGCLLVGRKVMTNLDSIFKSRDEKMLNTTHYQRNANQNHYEVPFHASQNGCDPKVYKQ